MQLFGAGNRRWRVGVGAVMLFVLASVAAVLAVGAEAGTTNPRLASVQRAPAAPIGATSLGAPAASASQTGFVVLKPRDGSALTRFIAAVSKPHSKQYHQYLKAGQFAGRFGPSRSTIAAVRSQLGADGLTVTSVARDGMLIGFSGTTAKVESAFDTGLQRYKSAAGITGEQTTKAISLPSNISGDVTAVIGLNTLVHPETGLSRPPKSAYAGHKAAKTAAFTHYAGAPAACSDASTDASIFGGLTDDQIANAYGANPLYEAGDTGAGVNIGVYELEPFSSSDLQTFDSCYFGSNSTPGGLTLKAVDGGQPVGAGSGESILDIEDVSAMAPGAHIDVYEAPNTSAGSLDEYARMVDDDTDQIITSSWGLCEQDLELGDPGAQQAEDYIFQQAAAQGQTVLSAAGDTGDDTCNEIRSVPVPTDQNPLSAEDPASQPYVLAVGGTTIQDANPSDYNASSETVWNDGAQWGGGGGGFSMSWAAPGWQQSAPGFTSHYNSAMSDADDVENNAVSLGLSDANQNWPPGFCANNSTAAFPAGTQCRTVPDVSAQADEFTGAVTIYSSMFVPPGGPASEGWITIGGTSSATPIWAAMLALADSSSACPAPLAGKAPGIGFANPLLYAVAANSAEYPESFHDITVGDNDVYGFDDGKVFPATTGYDLASGLGSPILAGAGDTPGLAFNLCSLATGATATPKVTGLNPTVEDVAPSQPLTITGSGFEPQDGATVQSVSVGADVIPGADVTVDSSTSLTIATLPAASATLAPNPGATTDLDTGTTYTPGGSTNGQDGAGLANIVVTMSDGTSSPTYANDPGASLYDQLTYADEDGSSNAKPSISSISPYAGKNAGATPITIYGSGFTSTDTVTVGGVPATGVSVVSPWELKAVTPASPDSDAGCVTESALESELGTSASQETNNICQTEVVVTDTSTTDSSATTAPLPTYLGQLPSENQDGILEVPSGYELTPAPDEFDYVPVPAITAVSVPNTTDGNANADPGAYGGPSLLAITGTGLNYQTMNWLSFGDPSQAAGQDISYPAYADGTNASIEAPADPDGTPASGSDLDPVAVTADTMAGSSTPDPSCASDDCVDYAGIPEVDLVTTADQTSTSPDTGGTAVTITGAGLSDVTGPLQFVDVVDYAPNPPFSIGNQYQYTISGDTEITTRTVSQNPAIVDTFACSDSGCSAQTANDELLLYPPGNPVITSIQDASGPAFGGTLVTINGENLGCDTSINFGSMSAMVASNAAALLDCGSTSQVQVVAPPGTAGASVPVTLSTVESEVTDAADATSLDATSGPTEFTYDSVNPSLTSSVSFGSIDLGSTSSETVTLTNPSAATQPLYPEPSAPNAAGTGSATVPATIGGADSGDFTITSDGCAGQTLTPGQSCAFQVQFRPAALGSRVATLKVPFDYSASVASADGFANPQTPDLQASLTGTGAEPTTTVSNTVTTPGTTTITTPGTTTTRTVTKTKKVICTITIRWRWVTVKVHGKKKREHKKFTTRSKGCKRPAKKAKKHKTTKRRR